MPLSIIDFGHYFGNFASILVLVLGFGFVIFFHELGHFLAAKWVGIKVEQFAVGFGQAILSWRQGIGLRVGNTQKEYQQRIEQYLVQHYKDNPQVREQSGPAYTDAVLEAERKLGLGETEYRLNWIPLGGYVKMLGQDDLRPNAAADDPRSYNRKPVRARMVVVSAGVIMNVILAGIGFMVLFMIGFKVPPAQVGSIASGSPAQNALSPDGKHRPMQVGDVILEYQGKPQEDFTKIGLNMALSPEGQPESIKVQHLDKSVEQLQITPQVDQNGGNFLSIGIGAPRRLEGPDPKTYTIKDSLLKLVIPDASAVKPGDTITRINDQDVKPEEFWKLDEALQNPKGAPVKLTVRDVEGKTYANRVIHPHFEHLFGGKELSFAGMMPRPAIESIQENSAARDKVQPGDVVVSVSVGSDRTDNPTSEQLRDRLAKAGEGHNKVTLVVLRDGTKTTIDELEPNLVVDREKGRRGLGITLMYDEQNPVVAGVLKDTPAEGARIPAGVTLKAIDGKKVSNWFDVQQLLSQATADRPVTVSYVDEAGEATGKLALNSDQIFAVSQLRRTAPELVLNEYTIVRKAKGPLQAAYWGVTETRDFILQFYLTLRRMAAGSVSPNQLMGPLGIFVGGARFAFKGWDWLLWFLAMISANLAVVNFLPIPIVDGGLFTFLILEKIKGRPLSPRTQAIAQYVGLAFLAGVFLFVTYHDLLRFTGFGS